MGYPFVYVLFDSILSSYLGETATNLRKIFDFIETGKFVVLFDEFDIVGKNGMILTNMGRSREL